MEVLQSADEATDLCALTLGNFDGVHIGHQAVLRTLVRVADERGLSSLAMTFDPHPAAVHRPDHKPQLITGLDEKLARIAATGVDATLVQPYSLEFADQSAEEFIEFLARDVGVRAIVVGRDVRFGRGNEGDLATLQNLGQRHGVETVVAIDDLGDGEGLSRVSSTHIRSLLLDGNVEDAARMLGRPHVVTGTVVNGNARGREMGFPTANIGGDVAGLIPSDGVYAGWVYFADGRQQPGAISVGSNPTFDGDDRRVEVNVVGVEFPDMDVYGEPARVEFIAHIRGQIEFSGMDTLIEQMRDDVKNVSKVLEAERRKA